MSRVSAHANMDEQRYINNPLFLHTATILCCQLSCSLAQMVTSWKPTFSNLVSQSDYPPFVFFQVNTITEMETHRNVLRLRQLIVLKVVGICSPLFGYVENVPKHKRVLLADTRLASEQRC